MSKYDQSWMNEALALAREAERVGDVPVGALVVHDNVVVGKGFNTRERDNDPVGHAELLAIRDAAKTLGRWRLTGCTLYVTLEPCPMCAGALVNARIDRLVYAAPDPRAGACGTVYDIVRDKRMNHRLVVTTGVEHDASVTLLKAFFAKQRRD